MFTLSSDKRQERGDVIADQNRDDSNLEQHVQNSSGGDVGGSLLEQGCNALQ